MDGFYTQASHYGILLFNDGYIQIAETISKMLFLERAECFREFFDIKPDDLSAVILVLQKLKIYIFCKKLCF